MLQLEYLVQRDKFTLASSAMMQSQNQATIIGREAELKILRRIYESNRAELLAVYGRRRIGKTYLISEFFKNKGYYFELTGAKDSPLKQQLNNFRTELGDAFYAGEKQILPENWQEAFDQLRKTVQKIPTDEKIILFFDELPWLASRRSGILSALEHVWNRYLSRLDNLILIVCGSSASWMINKVIYNKGGLYGRLTEQIHLKPFGLSETEQYFRSKNIILDRKQIIEIYLAFGGVAKYLANIMPGKSSAQIISENCFNKHGFLTFEFNKLFDSLFEKPNVYIAVVTALANKRTGLTQFELQKIVNKHSGGGFTKILEDLENSGFILACSEYPYRAKGKTYRLIDEYSLFYLTWIKPALENQFNNVNENYWQNVQNSPSYFAWAGYAFEGVCLKHIDKITDALKISVVTKSYASWSHISKADHKGAQIDLLIDRNDNCINLCEIKFCNGEYVVNKEYADKLKYKKLCFAEQTQTKKSLFSTLITTYGAKINQNYLVAIDNQLTMDALF
jgi:AAA+ ATPase superfamily predicted ATPase